MPQFSRCAVRAVQDAPLDHDCPADTGRHGQVDEILAVAGGAERHLAQGRDVCVAIEEYGQAQSRAKFRGDRDINETGPHVGRLKNDSSPRIHGAGAGDAHPDQPGPYLRGHGVAGPDEGRLAGIENCPGAIGDRRPDLGQGEPGPVVQHHRGADVRSSDIECEDWSC